MSEFLCRNCYFFCRFEEKGVYSFDIYDSLIIFQSLYLSVLVWVQPSYFWIKFDLIWFFTRPSKCFIICTPSKFVFLFQVFWAKGTQYFSDFHLWLSLLTCPSYSQFNRKQRLTCCLTLLMMYMCLNAMYYKQTTPEVCTEGSVRGL